MVKSGIVVSVNIADRCGVIEDKQKREYYFHVDSCVENELPPLWSTVTFKKDPDYKSTDVATLIKRSLIGKRAA
jgi:hypothetical protein